MTGATARTRITRALLGLCGAATIAGAIWSGADWKTLIDGFASDGDVDFVTSEIANGLRFALLFALPIALVLPRALRLARMPQAPPAELRVRRYPLFAGLLVLALTLTGLARIATDHTLTKDAKFYLSQSLEIADAGGVAALPGRCFRGEYRRDNQHPLYMAALSTFAERSDRFSDRARLVSLAGAIATLLLVLRYCRRRWGDGPSLVVAALVLTNGTFLDHATMVACESWQMAALLVWLDHVDRERERQRWWTWAVAGVAAGLAYLLKGTGTLLIVTTVLWLLARRRHRALPAIAVLVPAFALTALPLLWRNAVVFGTPFWNTNTSKVFWLDSWNAFFDPDAMAQASLSHYLATHSIVDIAMRLGIGSIKQGLHQLEIFSPVDPALACGLPLLLWAGLALWTDDRPARRSLLLLLFVLFFLPFAWYAQVVPGWRFLAVLVPLLLAPIAGHVARLPQPLRVAPPIIALLLGVGLVIQSLTGGALAFDPNRFSPAPEQPAVHAFLREHVGRAGHLHYLLGPTDGRTADWDEHVQGTRYPFPHTEAELADVMNLPWGRTVRFAIVEPPTGERAHRICASWVRDDPERGLVVADPPAGWTLVERIPADRPRVLVFRHD